MKNIYVRGTIGWHVNEMDFVDDVKRTLDSGEKDIKLLINSGGGSVFQGWGIFNSLKQFAKEGANFHTCNIGVAASMASVLMLVAKKENRTACNSSLYMIHNASVFTYGDKNAHKGNEEILSKIDDLLANEYSFETGIEKDYISSLMNKTTWLTPEESKELGFIGGISDENKDEGKATLVNFDSSAFTNNAPQDILNYVAFTELKDDLSKVVDLTKTTKQQIREKTWKNYISC